MITLETERLRLRPFTEDDLDDYTSMCADPEVMRFLGGKPWTRMEAWRHMATMLGHWQLRGHGLWAVEERATGRFVGRVGSIEPVGWPGFEIGWTLVRSAWGKGYATEAASRALEYAFSDLGREHVISLIHPENTASVAVARRIGETYERTIDFFDDRVHVYGIRRQDWNVS
jgi:RimJ/RimL family protein N-acetyltransferase